MVDLSRNKFAGVAELVYARDSKSRAARLEGSSPSSSTNLASGRAQVATLDSYVDCYVT